MDSSRVELIANIIFEYEKEFNGCLKNGYKDDKKFLNDLVNEISKNGTNELLEYYQTYSCSMNNTNSTSEKRKGIRNLILILQGQLN